MVTFPLQKIGNTLHFFLVATQLYTQCIFLHGLSQVLLCRNFYVRHSSFYYALTLNITFRHDCQLNRCAMFCTTPTVPRDLMRAMKYKLDLFLKMFCMNTTHYLTEHIMKQKLNFNVKTGKQIFLHTQAGHKCSDNTTEITPKPRDCNQRLSNIY